MITRCPRCDKPWNSATDDIVQMLNHSELHRWIDAGLNGKSNWAVRTIWSDPKAAIEHWLASELAEMGAARA